MQVNRIISRNRRVAGRATGYSSFVLKWPGGELSERCPYSTTLNYTIRLFNQRLRPIPPAEPESATAHLNVAVRQARGGVRQVTLASWIVDQPLPAFVQAVRLAWRRLPKEHDEEGEGVVHEIHDA